MFDVAAKKGAGDAVGNAPDAARYLLDPATGEPTG
jgi:hypothetical protein